jgi:hypothetical protein
MRLTKEQRAELVELFTQVAPEPARYARRLRGSDGGDMPVVVLGSGTILGHRGDPLHDPVITATAPEEAVDLALHRR